MPALNETLIRPRFCEVDSLSIVHHSRFIAWLEEANFAFVEKVLGLSRKELMEMGMHNPIQHLEIRYRNFVAWEDDVLIKTRMEYSQVATFTMHNTVCCRQRPEKIFAEAKVKLLITDKDLHLKLIMPATYLERIKSAEALYPSFFIHA